MFDFRYHVASLLAVFIALVIGILVGIGLSGRGFVTNAERKNLESQISDLRSDRDAARAQLTDLTRRQVATDAYAAETYPALVPGRLKDKRVALVFVGSIDQGVDRSVVQAVRDAGGRVVRVRALRMPMDERGVQAALAKRPAFERYAGREHVRELGRDIGRELVVGGKTPLLDALSDVLVEERDGRAQPPADGVVVSRPARPQEGATQSFLSGLYRGIASSGAPAVGVERAAAVVSAIPAFTRSGLSTVDSVDTAAGRLAVVLELDGSAPGHYGVEESASNGILPPLPPTFGKGG